MPPSHPRQLAFSQNFLTDRRLVDRLLDAAGIGPGDTVYDIGAGSGIITERLARRCRRVVAIEQDERLAALLCRRFGRLPSITVRHADALHVPLPCTPYKVFANIPFTITTAIVSGLITAPNPPDDCHLVMQREAAARFAGTPWESLYAVLMKPWFEPSVTHYFRRADFAPPPNVEVVMLRLRKRGPPLVDRAGARLYRDVVTYCFTAWQPSLRHTLRGIFTARQLRRVESALALDPRATPAEVSFEQWLQLFHEFKRVATPEMRAVVAGAAQRLRRQQEGLRKDRQTRVQRQARRNHHRLGRST